MPVADQIEDVVAEAKWWDFGFYWSRFVCWLFGHREGVGVRDYFRDPDSREAKELSVLFLAAFGNTSVCRRCGKPLGDQDG